MLDSDFNSRYWRCITEKYSNRDFALKIFLALSASGAVAGWSVWSNYPEIWKVLSGAAAVASIASPLLAFSKKAEVAAAHAGLWANLRVRCADLWAVFQSKGETESLQREHARLRKIFADLEEKEPRLKIAQDRGLARECQQEVLRAKRLAKEG
ncbi:hypothetical protein [Variovorax sp. WS11]|nr:hypothetical protein [Variovorax sp. WS11]